MSAGEIEPGVPAARIREAFSRWASGVAVAAVREDDQVLATTVTALVSVSVNPPLLLVSLGPTAQVLPYLTPGRRFGVSVLAEGQARTASVYADSFPVGASAFPAEGDPVIADALVQIVCVVERVETAADHRLVIARVVAAETSDGAPLIRFARAYRRLDRDP